MLRHLHLEQFKCFERLSLPLAPLTLLTGLNASGKSSVIQSLALLNQTIRANEWANSFHFNGPILKMGTAGDVINKMTGRNDLSIGIETETTICKWKASTTNRTELVMPINDVQIDDEFFGFPVEGGPTPKNLLRWLIPPKFFQDQPTGPQKLSAQIRNLTYISAERLGPREVYESYSEDDVSTVGVQGERTAHYLFKNSLKLTRKQMLKPTAAAPQIPRQTAAWLADFFPGAEFETEPVVGANLVLLRIRSHPSTDYHRPQNVGYGLTHILPILAACLGADCEQIIMIDNPEAHLHPSGQAKMGYFLARVAASGIQLIVETHSDHVLNGIRRAVRDGLLGAEKTAIHFFAQETTSEVSRPIVVSPTINARGQLDKWPQGFFDQFDNDMMALIDWKK